MAVTRRALQLGIAAAMLCPAAGMHGFIDSLKHGSGASAEAGAARWSTRSAADSLRLALGLGSSGAPGDEAGPQAEKVFSKYDQATPTGYLSAAESEQLLRELGFDDEEIRQMQHDMDANVDGFVDRPEFSHYLQPPEQAAREAPAPPAPPAPAPAAEPKPKPQAFASRPAEAAQPQMPPIGRDETARALQNHAARTQDTLVDAVENAEVAEIKRSVFRSLFRLRSAQIKEYDTIAKKETQAIDEYNDKHSYRSENPISHLSDLESDVETDKYATFHDGRGDSEDA